MKKIEALVAFLQTGIWQIDTGRMSPWWKLLLEIAKKLILAVRFFTTKRVVADAAALTYSTLLAIVPILAVVFAIARGFGYSKYIELWFRDAFKSQPQAAEVIVGFVNSYLVHTKSGIFLGVGLAFMLYTVLMLVSNVEATFNNIWQVKKPRSIFRTFTDYLAFFFLFPILIVLSSGVSLFVATAAQKIPDFLLLGSAMRFLIDLSPYVLMSLMFIGLYVFMPNTHVRIKNAIVPGVLAGVAMQLLQFFYIHSQIWVSSYNAIYGSFAALPLFMLWVQISWIICLFGAELCYTNQNLDYYDYNQRTADVSHRYRMLLCALLMSRICKRFDCGGKPYTALDLRRETGIPIRVVNDLLYALVGVRLLIEVSGGDKGESSHYVPAENIERLSVGIMVDRLEAHGKWRLSLPLGKHYNGEWAKILECRSSYLKELRNIKLKEL